LRKSGKKRYCKKKYWIAPIFQERKVHGFFHAVLPKLVLEDLRFNNYIRMSATQFEKLTFLVGADIFAPCEYSLQAETFQRTANDHVTFIRGDYFAA
ncbi:hypothetical protein X777_09711, partial [Ooceraea biroi]